MMLDEILKHSRKIKQTMRSKKHALGEKLKEIMIEVLIIVFAVTLSIQLHSWSEHKHQQQEAKEFLSDLKADLLKDISIMKEQQVKLNRADSAFERYIAASRQLKNGEAMPQLEMYLISRSSNNGYYEGFKSSGKIGYIENRQIRNSILNYYQDSEPKLRQLEQLNKTISIETGELLFSKRSPKALFEDTRLEAKAGLMTQSRAEILKTYDENIQAAQLIITAIDKELKG